jgi:hypothetical protein
MLTALPPRGFSVLHAAFILSLCFTSCNRASNPSDATAEKRPEKKTSPQALLELWTQFDGNRALENVSAQVACGPRPSGSPELAKARTLILESLKSSDWSAEVQEFSAETPHGNIPMANLVARFAKPDAKASALPKVLVCSHYDTKKFSTISFVGANDGASSTGALLELARVLALDPELATRVELVFFDGEEAVQQFSETDGLYGSRHYATQLRNSGRHTQYQYGILWDMIGDKNLSVTLPLDSPKELTQGYLASAEALQQRPFYRIFDRPMLDDHVPLNQIARIPTLDVIDFEYDAWHTADDTMQQISPQSLASIGWVTLHYLCRTLRP